MFNININKFLAGVPAALALFVLAGCSSMPSMSSMSSSAPSSSATSSTAASATGVVQSVERVDQKDAGIGVGTIAGAVVGGLIGNQVGSGTGRTAATVAGAAGGALGGRAIENRTRQSGQAYRVTLRMDDGSQQVFATETDPQFRVGERVQVVNGIVQHY